MSKLHQSGFIYRIRVKLSRSLKQPVMLAKNCLYDFKRYRTFCVASGRMELKNRLATITALYHVLEKGLSFRNSRSLFGKANVKQLFIELTNYLDAGGLADAVEFQSALKVLSKYLEKHAGAEFSENTYIQEIRNSFSNLSCHHIDGIANGGWKDCTKKDIQQLAKGGYPEMALSRYSVRDFSDEPVTDEIIENAIVWAQKSPSVCNRQSSRIHALRDKKMMADILEIHGGTRGFAEQIDVLLLVAGDLRVFFGSTERNQVYLDAGIFAMSLMYGLHYQGVGSCPLHWCVSPEQDLAIREVAHVPEEETISTLIAVGHLPERFKVAYSQRINPEDVISWK